MVDEEIGQVRTFLFKNKDELKFWVSLALDAAKIVVTFSGPVGLYIVIVYLQSVRAPLPISDLSNLTALIIIGGAYICIAMVVLVGIYSPLLMCSVSRSFRRQTRVRSLDILLNHRRWVRYLVGEALLFQGGAIMVMPTFSALVIVGASLVISILWLATMLIFGSLIGVILYCRVVTVHMRPWHWRMWLACQVFITSVVRGLCCIGWLLLMARLNLAFPIVENNQANLIGRIVTWLIFLAIVMVGYLMLTSETARFSRFPAVLLSGALLGLAVYPAFFGQRTLHFLGVGGGIPVDILLKTMEPQDSSVAVKLVHSCLILNVGSHVIIQLMDSQATDTCDRELPQEEATYATMHRGVEVLSNADIIKISGSTTGAMKNRRN